MNLASHLVRSRAEYPDRPALICPKSIDRPSNRVPGAASNDVVMTFRDLDERSALIAGAFAELGLRARDRVIVLAGLSPDLYAALIALLRLGATAVFLDPQAGRSQLEAAAREVSARALIGSPLVVGLRHLSPALRTIPLAVSTSGHGALSLTTLAERGTPRDSLADVTDGTPALISFTSGSTAGATGDDRSGEANPSGPLGTSSSGRRVVAGRQAILRTHSVLEAQHRALERLLPFHPGDVDLPAFPILVLHNLASGVPSVVPTIPRGRPDTMDAGAVLAAMNRHGVTTAAASPAFWARILEVAEKNGTQLGLRRIVTGGAPADPRLMAALGNLAPGAETWSVYGSSEAEPVAAIRGEEILDLAGGAGTSAPLRTLAPGSGAPLGWVVPEIRLRVLDDAGREVDVGRPGELWVAGSHVASGTFADIDAGTPQVLADPSGTSPHSSATSAHPPEFPDDAQWHRMGDVGYRDADGRLWQLGRIHTTIRRVRGIVYPVAIEQAVQTLPFVARAAVVGVPRLGQSVEADSEVVLALQINPDLPQTQDGLAQASAIASQAAQRWSTANADSLAPAPVDRIVVVTALPMDQRHQSRIDYVEFRRQLLDRGLGRHVWAYLQERFPPVQHGLLIGSYFAANTFLAQASSFPDAPLVVSWRFIAGAIVLLCMFFHLRVIDEHRDFESDRVVHPNRVLSRGFVTLSQLRWAGIAAVAIELALSIALGPGPLLACLLVLALSAAIANDFWLHERLTQHMLTSAVVHMLIMPAFSLFGHAVATGRPPWTAPLPVLLYAWVSYGVAMAYELARKTRAPEDERPGLVTYSSVWGPYVPAYLALTALVVAGLLSSFTGSLLSIAHDFHAWVAGLLAVVGVGVLHFRWRTNSRTAGRLAGLAGMFIFAFDGLLSFELIRLHGIVWR